VILYRRTLLQQLARVERGEDPLGMVRDRAKNTPWIDLPMEREVGYSLTGTRASTAYEFPEAATEPATSKWDAARTRSAQG
jgi:hypothetical protein